MATCSEPCSMLREGEKARGQAHPGLPRPTWLQTGLERASARAITWCFCQGQCGWKNLAYLNSMAYLEGFYYNPRIDKKLLRAHREGLIGMSACLGGEVAQTIMRAGRRPPRPWRVSTRTSWAGKLLPGDPRPTDCPTRKGQRRAHRHVGAHGIPLVATNDCHYLDRQDARARRC